MKYICEKCNMKFNQKSNYERHINRKTSCIKEEKYEQDIKKRTCEYCCKVFSDIRCVTRHIKSCKEKPSKEDELKQLLIHMQKTIDDQNEKINNLQGNTTNNITNNNTINIQQNIVINAYGKEDMSHITIEDYKKILQKGCYSISELIKYVHCNAKKPENRNIYIKNYKDDYILTFDGTDWNMEKKDDVFVNIIENRKNFLENKFEDYYDQLSKPAKSTFKKFLERSDNNEVINNIKEELKNEFYKNRTHIKKNITNKKLKKIK